MATKEREFILASLKGGSLDATGYYIAEFSEVYRVDEDGRRSKSLGFFKDEDIAKAYAQNQTDAFLHKTEKRYVLTNGKTGFVIGEAIEIFGDEKATLEIRNKALAKLSDEEKKVLGF